MDEDFEGEYLKDYKALHNELIEGVKTAWLDKYTTALYTTDYEEVNYRRYELQPIPDYLRWYKTGELHYLPLEERTSLVGPWDAIPGVYLPTKVLDLCFSIVQDPSDDIIRQISPSDDIIRQISLLSWTTTQEVRDYYRKIQTQVDNQIKAEIERERWKSHDLYKTKSNLKPYVEMEKYQ